jgi:hypothetical protein
MSTSIAMPRERVLELARAVRRSRRAYASALMFLSVGLGMVAREMPYVSMLLTAVGFVLAGRQWWLANDAQRAFTLANDPAITFALTDGSVVASDAQGVLRVDASFDLTRRQRAVLTALPTAALKR